jgi:superfamily II DNA or RNA helicase
MLEQYRDLFRAAAKALRGVCDGAKEEDGLGFRKGDVPCGWALAELPDSYFDEQDLKEVYQFLRIYRNQLASIHGITLPLVMEIEEKPVSDGWRKRYSEKIKRFEKLKLYNNLPENTIIVKVIRENSYSAVLRNNSIELRTGGYNDALVKQLQSLKAKGQAYCKKDGNTWVWYCKPNKDLVDLLDNFSFFYLDNVKEACERSSNVPEKAIEEQPKVINLTLKGSNLIFITPGKGENPKFIFDNFLYSVKQIPGRFYSGEERANYIPCSLDNCKKAIALAKEHGLSIDQTVIDQCNTLESTYKKSLEESFKAVSDFQINNFGNATLQPFPFQRAGIEYASRLKSCLIADEMGLGKTIQALGVFQTLECFPAIVVCPKAVIRQWRDEVKRWIPNRTVSLYANGKTNWEADIIVINYEMVSKNLDKLLSIGFKAIAIDEAHYIKNYKAQRSVAVQTLSKSIKVKLALTGTPVLNRPNEILQILCFLDKVRDFGGFKQFLNRYCFDGEYYNGARNLTELAEKLRSSCMIRRMKKQVAKEMPDLIRSVLTIPVDNLEEYNCMMHDIVEWFKSVRNDIYNTENQAAALVKIEKLKQLAVKAKMGNCVDWIKEFLDNSEEKLVVFAHHHNILEQLVNELKDYSPVSITGMDSADKREANKVKFWEDKNCRVIVCSLKAANVGLNLQVASNVVFLEYAWHAADMDQAEARVHRIGTEASSVNSYWLVGENTFDADMVHLIESKRAVSEMVTADQAVKSESLIRWFMNNYVDETKTC